MSESSDHPHVVKCAATKGMQFLSVMISALCLKITLYVHMFLLLNIMVTYPHFLNTTKGRSFMMHAQPPFVIFG